MAKNGSVHPSRIFKTTEALAKAWSEYKESLKEEYSDQEFPPLEEEAIFAKPIKKIL